MWLPSQIDNVQTDTKETKNNTMEGHEINFKTAKRYSVEEW